MRAMDTSPKTEAETVRDRRRRVGRECADRLIRARVAAGMTESEAAKASGLPRSTWQEYEDGAIPDAVRGGRIEEALGVPRGAIYHDTASFTGEHAVTSSDDETAVVPQGPRVEREGFDQSEGA